MLLISRPLSGGLLSKSKSTLKIKQMQNLSTNSLNVNKAGVERANLDTHTMRRRKITGVHDVQSNSSRIQSLHPGVIFFNPFKPTLADKNTLSE